MVDRAWVGAANMSSATGEPVVLVIEDEPLILELMQSALADAGFRVVVATDDKEAMAIIEGDNAPALAGIVTDVNLGRDLTGWDIARRAREVIPNLPVVYVTGDSAHEWTAHGVPQSAIIGKPFAPAQVVVALSGLLNKTDTET
jgi:DNA-binding response OmpR family regulator